MRVFISYAREDETEARRLYASLKDIPGVMPWIDVEDLLPGDDWEQSIREAMEKSRFLILLLSNNSVSKEGFVQKEVRDALELLQRRPPGVTFVIPARIEFCTPKFNALRKLNWLDLFDDWNGNITKLRRTVFDKELARERALAAKKDGAQEAKNRSDAKRLIADLPPRPKEEPQTIFRLACQAF